MTDERTSSPVHGLLLAAGQGSRMGRPKALVTGADGEPWLERSVRVLRDGGCSEVTIVLGADAEAARGLVPPGALVVVADDWRHGMSASLRAGLDALGQGGAAAALVHLVDLPDVGADVVARLVAVHDGPDVLARATYGGRPGHPVLLGRSHWAGVAASVTGDGGARDYLARGGAIPVECGDLASGRDQDRPLP